MLPISSRAANLIVWARPALGHSRPSRLARKATHDRSCLKADIRRASTGLVLEIEIPERLPGGVLHDEAGVVVLFDRPRRREAARGGHGRYRGCVGGFHSLASLCASAICSGVIRARRYHFTASTWSCRTPSPRSYWRPSRACALASPCGSASV
jgi:hypothetical protein